MTTQVLVSTGSETICIDLPLSSKCKSITNSMEKCSGHSDSEEELISIILTQLENKLKIPRESQLLLLNSRELKKDEQLLINENNENEVQKMIVLRMQLRGGLCGGKGGFGALLRGSGKSAKRTTNFDDCRDLNGKRIRTVKNEIRLKQWYEEQAQKALMPKKPSKNTVDKDDKFKRNLTDFINTARGVESNISSAVEMGLQKALQRKQNKKEEQEAIDATSELANVVVCDNCGTTVRTGSNFYRCLTCTDYDLCENCYKKNDKLQFHDTTHQFEECSLNDESDEMEVENSRQIDDEEEQEETTAAEKQELLTKKQETQTTTNTSKQTQTQSNNEKQTQQMKEKEQETPKKKVEEEIKPTSTVNLENIKSVDELVALGADVLKNELQARGLLFGGTVQQRAERLFSIKGKSADQIPAKLLTRKRKADEAFDK